MKTKLFKTLVFGIIIMYAPLQTMAWGSAGHRIAGRITEKYLTPKVRRAVKAILGHESIATASNWADYIKSNPDYRYTSSWHYIDLDKVYTYPQLVNFLKRDKNDDAYTKIEFFISELKKKDLSKKEQQFDLRMLIHLVEDVHQPMHVAHANDRGGNDFKVYWFNEATNLHAVWDVKLIDYQRLSDSKYAKAINHATPSDIAKWQSEPVSKWLYESNRIAEKLYTDIRPGQNLDGKYAASHTAVLNTQLLKAGVRLAGVLNKIFR